MGRWARGQRGTLGEGQAGIPGIGVSRETDLSGRSARRIREKVYPDSTGKNARKSNEGSRSTRTTSLYSLPQTRPIQIKWQEMRGSTLRLQKMSNVSSLALAIS